LISIYPNLQDPEDHKNQAFFEDLSELAKAKIIPFSCGRAALVYSLEALEVKRIDEILVPPYLGHCVVSALSKTTFPSMSVSHRTKAILVYHQFGYPQKVDEIEKIAHKHNWIIANDCVNSLSSEYQGTNLLNWGDFAIVSLAKLYSCAIGGGLVFNHNKIQQKIATSYKELYSKHLLRANQAYQIILQAEQNPSGDDEQFELQAAEGYLPELVAFPSKALASLPQSAQEIKEDINHRRNLLQLVQERFPNHTPDSEECDVTPFAIPIKGEPSKLENLSLQIKKILGVEAPVLHFDFARNMLAPDYKKSLIIGCHSQWTVKLVNSICDIIGKEGN
jgi:hypothetical protein